MEWKPILIIGSKQANAFVGSVEGYASCITAACGMGGGHIPMLVEEDEGIIYREESAEELRNT